MQRTEEPEGGDLTSLSPLDEQRRMANNDNDHTDQPPPKHVVHSAHLVFDSTHTFITKVQPSYENMKVQCSQSSTPFLPKTIIL